ncbi:MAG: DegT/DnrJ/EryC1/StrS aminotransferase family protein [Thermoanaerobaculia bacterium]
MRDTFLEFSPPCLGDEEIAEVVDALRSGWITTGPKVRRFEEEFADAVGTESALAVASATDAMQVGLAAAGIGPGDEVITTPMTFSSTVHVIEHIGATPVLVDVEPDTLCIDPVQIERAITTRTKALLPVHLYGHPCEMGRILDLARTNDLTVLEDAAHALPAVYEGQSVGSIGDLTAFSFYATKNLTTGEGGMLTGSAELIDLARPWALHGMTRDSLSRYRQEGSWYYEVVLPGFKCNMTDIQAAMGLQQLRKLAGFQQRRQAVVERYSAALVELPEIEIPVERDRCQSAWHIFAIRLRLERLQIDRAQFIEELTRRRIGTSVHFIPVHLHPYYRDKYGFRPEDFPVAWESYRRLVSLPLHPGLTERDVEDVIEVVTDVVARFRR